MVFVNMTSHNVARIFSFLSLFFSVTLRVLLDVQIFDALANVAQPDARKQTHETSLNLIKRQTLYL